MSIDLAAYEATRAAHTVVGALATFGAFPLAFLSTKGSPLHRRAGYAATLLSLAVAVTGAGMLANPLFAALWRRNETVLGPQWVLFFDELLYEPLFFLWLDVLLLYFCGSAIRVWMRLRSIRRGGPSFGIVDVVLAAALASGSVYMLFVGAWDLLHLSVHPFAVLFVELGLYTLLFAAIDVVTFVAAPRHLETWGFALHGYKFFSAWDGLLTAFLLRLRLASGTFDIVDTLYGLVAHGLILVLLGRYFLARRRAGTVAGY